MRAWQSERRHINARESCTSYVATARLNLTRSASLALASAAGQDSHNYAALHCYTPAVYSTPSMYSILAGFELNSMKVAPYTIVHVRASHLLNS